MFIFYMLLLFILVALAVWLIEESIESISTRVYLIFTYLTLTATFSYVITNYETLKEENEKLSKIVIAIQQEKTDKILTKVFFDDTPVLIHTEIVDFVSANENDKLTIQQQRMIREIYNISVDEF